MAEDTPEPPNSGAIRMMAFGVFTADKPVGRRPASIDQLFYDPSPRLEEEQLVMNEFDAHGWLLKIEMLRHRGKSLLLLGPLEIRGAFRTRPIIGRGTMQEICQRAVEFLDGGLAPCTSEIETAP